MDEVAAEHYKADSIIHFGATCLSPTQHLPVLYVLCCQPVDVVHAADQVRAVCTDSAARLILMADTMYQHALGELLTTCVHFLIVGIKSEPVWPSYEWQAEELRFVYALAYLSVQKLCFMDTV